MVGLINKAALVGAITAAAHAIVGLHLEDIDSLESAAAAGVCVVLAGMTGYGGRMKTLADDVKEFFKVVLSGTLEEPPSVSHYLTEYERKMMEHDQATQKTADSEPAKDRRRDRSARSA